ncbi:unnamed protein product [Gordionus sp. m RMFG-2023]
MKNLMSELEALFNLDDEENKLINSIINLENKSFTNDYNNDNFEFDKMAGEIWIYPNNFPIRDYQYNIVKKALFNNTLVALPTGLGKTFIAAVVMFNYYRWFPRGKIIFMAPTRPLVNQQIEACHKIMATPIIDTTEMTGKTNPIKRKKLWAQKRVIFLTPQVLANDLINQLCPAHLVKCLVVDEAHRALGNYAYCQVIQEMLKVNQEFRILALTATPGRDIKTIESVLSNLLISHLEFRTEQCLDVQPYTFAKTIHKIVVPLTPLMEGFKEKLTNILDICSRRLVEQKVLFKTGDSIENMSKFSLIQARARFRSSNNQKNKFIGGLIERDFAVCITLIHSLELITFYGLRCLHTFIKNSLNMEQTKPQVQLCLEESSSSLTNNSRILTYSDESNEPQKSSHAKPENSTNKNNKKGCNATKSVLTKIPQFQVMYAELDDFIDRTKKRKKCRGLNVVDHTGKKDDGDDDDRIETETEPYLESHPKLGKLKELVEKHFAKHAQGSTRGGSTSSNVIIFSQYRESVIEISQALSRSLYPLVKVGTFLGQQNMGKAPKNDSKNSEDIANTEENKDSFSGENSFLNDSYMNLSVKKCKTVTQKDQLKVLAKFRSGQYNTLVSTCVGEEGLDIGSVDCIFCFDSVKSPVRYLQRIGRTARMRAGDVYVFLTKGKEEKIYNQSLSNKKSVFKALEQQILQRFKDKNNYNHKNHRSNPKILPPGVNPKPCLMYIGELAVSLPLDKGPPANDKQKSTPSKSRKNCGKENSSLDRYPEKKEDSHEIESNNALVQLYDRGDDIFIVKLQLDLILNDREATFLSSSESQSVEECWASFKNNLFDACNHLPNINNSPPRQEWLIDNTIRMIAQLKLQGERDGHLWTSIHRLLRRDRRIFIAKKAFQIDRDMKENRTFDVYKKLNYFCKAKVFKTLPTIRLDNNKLITDPDEQMALWLNHYMGVFDSRRPTLIPSTRITLQENI